MKEVNNKNFIEDLEVAEKVKNVLLQVITIDQERIFEFKKEFEDVISQYEAIGIVDGHNYFTELDDMKGRLARLEALINLINVLHETNHLIKRDKRG